MYCPSTNTVDTLKLDNERNRNKMSVWLYEMAVLIHTEDIPQIRYEHVIFLWNFFCKSVRVFAVRVFAGEYGAVYRQSSIAKWLLS